MAHGRRANAPLVAAVALGDSTALAMSLVGLGALLATSAFWFTAVKWAGGLYLLYLGIRLLRPGASLAIPVAPAATGTRWRLFANTSIRDRAEPRGHCLLRGVLAAVHQPAGQRGPSTGVLAITFVVLAVLNATLYALFAASARRLLASSTAQRRFNVVGGSLLSLAGVWALMARRAA